jgi:4-amino-4-deoxy-L-arabinose transferase-like glycosyltransferase
LPRPTLLIAAAIVVLALLRATLAATTELSDDEAYYRLWALAPALSYLDHPPMVAWLIAAGQGILGDTPLGIRFAAVLTSLVGPLALWRTVSLLFGADVAERAVAFALAMPLLSVGGIIITPDLPSVWFWGLTGWAMAELYVSENPNWWLAVGLFSGLGLLSKYTNLFVGAGILIWLIGLKANWRWFRSWQLWAGAAISAFLTLPVFVWNSQHGWASFAKQFGRVVRDQTFSPVYLLEAVGSFVLLASPIIAALALLGLGSLIAAVAKRRDPAALLLAASLFPLLLYFGVHALHARVQPNWMAPLYPALAAAAAIAVTARHATVGVALRRRSTGAALGLGVLLTGLMLAHAAHPLLVSTKDPTSQMRGWREFAQEIDRLRRVHGACAVATSHYTISAQLAYHLPTQVPVLPLNEPLRYAHLPAVGAAALGCGALYVELERRPLLAGLHARFARVLPLGTATRSYQGRSLARYNVVLLGEPRGPGASRDLRRANAKHASEVGRGE